jgi:hypothetical protein
MFGSGTDFSLGFSRYFKTASLTALGLVSMALPTLAETKDEFFEPKTTLGGYGELHLNYKKTDGKPAPAPELDFHRFILFVSHQFAPNFALKSEIELEHNFVQDNQGELELEQAYIEYSAAPWFRLQTGVILAAAGLMNEFHEPPLFLSVERPDYHNQIIPTTWYGNGAAIAGTYRDFEFKVLAMEGLNTAKIDSGTGLRGARQKGYRSKLDNVLLGLKADYVGLSGLRAGLSYHRNHLMNNVNAQRFESIDLVEGHAQFEQYGARVVAEAAWTSYSKIDGQPASRPEASQGFLVELAYNVLKPLDYEARLYPWVRYSNMNKASQSGIAALEDKYATQKTEWGLAFMPHPKITYKFDMGFESVGDPSVDAFLWNAGVGYMF